MRAFAMALLVTFGLVFANDSWSESIDARGTDTGPATSGYEAADPDFRLYRQKLAAAHALARADQHAGADRALATLIADPKFGALSTSDQRATLSAAGWAAVKLDRLEDARDLYLRATAIGPEDPDDWYRLSTLEWDLKHVDASAAALTHFTERWPELLTNVDVDYLLRLVRELDPGSQTRLNLLQAMFDANWENKQGGASSVWFALALAQIERGDAEAAMAAIKRVVSPSHLIKLRSDKRFDALVTSDAWTFNVEHAARRQAEELQLQVSLDPSTLDKQVQLSYAMLTAGMNEEVIALADSAVAKIASAPADAPPFTDIGNQVWLMNNRAIALRRTGLVDEALAELLRGSQLDEDGQVNVSQALNLGQFYCSLNRPDEALAAIGKVGLMSGYGRLVQASVQQRAALQQGDAAGAARALAYIREHREDSQTLLLEALIEAGHLADAARAITELLTSPYERPELLEWLQEYRMAPVLPGDERARANRKALLARPDLQEAVMRVGRIQQYGIYGSYGME